jgi:hypothetical protein
VENIAKIGKIAGIAKIEYQNLTADKTTDPRAGTQILAVVAILAILAIISSCPS